MKILILYYSGVGNTEMVATGVFKILTGAHEVELLSIEKLPMDISLMVYDAFVIGFPTIHSAPAKPILDFLHQIEVLQKPVPTFLFTTCGLYSANTLRIFAQKCVLKNFIPVLCKSYRCAATDGILIVPSMNIWFCHERRLDEKIQIDVRSFLGLLNQPLVAHLPRFKFYSILNYPNKFLGQRFSPKIVVHIKNCVSCGKCVRNCPVHCIHEGSQGHPLIDNQSCIHCYRCIHHCPNRALSLSKKHPPSKTLFHHGTK